MNKKIKAFIVSAAVIAAAGSFMITANASDDTAGSSGDPLVSKSYVDSAMANLMAAINAGGTEESASAAFEPVRLEYGQILLGKEGSEIILRSGSALSYSESADGVIDVTLGEEYFNGDSIEKNHLIITSRDDGRGAIVTSDEAWFIVKGGYDIK